MAVTVVTVQTEWKLIVLWMLLSWLLCNKLMLGAIAIAFAQVVVAQSCVVAGGGGSPIDSIRLAATGKGHSE